MFNTIVSVKSFGLRKETLILSDMRAKQMTECISGVRIIKYFGWEQMILKNMERIRMLESHIIL